MVVVLNHYVDMTYFTEIDNWHMVNVNMLRTCMNSRQEWSSVPWVVTGWGYMDHSLVSEFLRVVYTTQVHTYNHGAELELQNGQSK